MVTQEGAVHFFSWTPGQYYFIDRLYRTHKKSAQMKITKILASVLPTIARTSFTAP